MMFETFESRQMLSATVTPFATQPAKSAITQTVATQKPAVSQPVVPAVGGTAKTPDSVQKAEQLKQDQQKMKEEAARLQEQQAKNFDFTVFEGIFSDDSGVKNCRPGAGPNDLRLNGSQGGSLSNSAATVKTDVGGPVSPKPNVTTTSLYGIFSSKPISASPASK